MENDRGRGRGRGRGRWGGRGRGFPGAQRSNENDYNCRGGGRGRFGSSGRNQGSGSGHQVEKHPGEKPLALEGRLQVGEISALIANENFGFIKVEGASQTVKFRHGDGSKTDTGLLDLEIGDVLQFTLNDNAERPRAAYARLVQCRRRSPVVLDRYLHKLLCLCDDSPGKVVREITKCPVGFLLVLELRQPPQGVVCRVLVLADVLRQEGAAFYGARVKQFFKFFCGTEFLRSPGALKEYLLDRCREEDEEEGLLIHNFMLCLMEQSPESVTDLLPLIESMMEIVKRDNLAQSRYCDYVVELLRCHAGVYSSAAEAAGEKLPWDKMPLVPVSAEITSSKSLPFVKKKGGYGSVDEYLDTYYTLLREDCFAPLRKGLGDLRANKLDPRDMKVWTNGSVLGIHFSRRNPGITFAITAQRLGGEGPVKLPMPETLLCISDDGGKFESMTWGVVARCEEDNKSRVMFVEPVGGKAGAGGSSAQCINRLLGASGLVFAENPTFYKAYELVLRRLQQMECHNFPFLEEFVYAKWTHQPAQYLSNPATTVDWGCLFGETSVRSGVKELDNLMKDGYKTTLDASQLNAIRLAVNNRLVLIQGPPGTGKSFVGVRILRIALSADTLPAGPALVVTYKNQGLDHFLLSCLKFCPEGVVRVGGRSTEPTLERFNLFSLLRKSDEFTPDLFDNTKKLERAQREIEEALKQLQGSRDLSLESVLRHMPDFQLRLMISQGNHDSTPELIPEEVISLSDLLGEDSQHSKDLYQVISQTLKNWMPNKKTFKMIQECFSRQKTSGALKQLTTRCAIDETDTDILDEEIKDNGNALVEQFLQAKLEEEEDFDEPDEKSNKGRKKNDCLWLKENFFTYKSQAFDTNLTVSNDIDFEHYQWLLDENPWDLNESHRAILVQLIMQTSYQKAVKRVEEAKKAYDEICQDIEEISKRRQLQVLKKAKIVGMTTTGAALNQELLKALNPAIVFVEEAAEVLEPQLLAVLGPSVQHLILIGDHYQLSPTVEVYELERRHGFAISLFERLVEHNKLPFQALSSQSRMREEFVPMILPIYPNLRTNTQFVSGERNKAPMCMSSSMYFWSHSYGETKQRSVANEGEAKMVIALVRWMIAEGQNPDEITVLASYNGQVTLLRDMLKVIPAIEAIQILTIDRFQGSENQIIILSLVRSNDEGSIGHLAKRNRLCVAVSRARGALYFCGNYMSLTKKSEHWRELLEYLAHKNCVGDRIHLRCPRHPLSPPFAISSKLVDNFNPLLCRRTCNSQLSCGHYCQSTCHYGDHPKCIEPVQFTFSICRHEITKKCSEDGEMRSCQQELMHTFDSCGHTIFVKCWEKMRKELKCNESCRKVLTCQHPCMLKCFENCEAKSCSTCIEIQRINAEKAKQLEAQQVKMKLLEIKAEIKKLEESSDGPERLVIDISPTGDSAADYFQVMDRTEKFTQPGHDVVLVVTRIQKVFNPKVQINFLRAQQDLFEPTGSSQLLFHGTDNAGVEGITQNGFRLPEANRRNMFGRGCYFATDSTKSAQNMYTKGSNKLLLCEVLLGHTWTVQEDHPEMDRDQIRRKGYDSLFSKRGGKGTGGTLYDEYVIYNPHQAIPRYIVHYKNQHDPQALQAHNFQNNITRIAYEPSLTFNGDSPGEYHFRQAESQFYRMSSRRNQKVRKVELIFNKILQESYDTAKQELMKNNSKVLEMFVFHGTDKSAIEKIVQEGFKIGGKGVSVRNGAVYGTGVYTALDPDISVDYSRGSGMMLLSLALVGQEGIHYNKGGSADVYVLHNPEYLLPRYIVHFANN
ncbi:hypothetical protein SUGI_0246490 [Cryptomeria japonica]|uniref:uncharacterized protein LOC131036014 n=1 Tax=Cryptomeria japonica TaxID=3369 RepID=UPI002408B050|nr:uncharacterized protein LOC131036014 [Cryptomeria japonica]GLJ15080.1 hypothetical protein SUGI_0246490 [Cryptomeria japonica]